MKRKHHTKRKVSGTHRRRTHSKKHHIGGIDTTNVLGVIAGAVIAGYLNKLIPATVNDKVVAGGKIALGLALPMLVKSGSMKNIVSGVGSGMIAVGSVDLLKSFNVLSGTFDIPTINGDILAGDILAEDIPVINGDNDLNVINGDEDFINGDDELGEDEFGADFLSGDDE